MLGISHAVESASASGGPVLHFTLTSGFVSYVVPNFLTFAAIPKIGSGLAAIMFALSPVVTALLSMLLRIRPPSLLGLAGIGLGLAGALVIIAARNADFAAGQSVWLLLSVLIPIFLGLGNVYRTMAWPKGAGPMRLAALTNLAAVAPLLIAAALYPGGIDAAPLLAVPGLVAAQLAISATMLAMFFRLQQVVGPTYLSQIGYAAAAVGFGVAVLGETYPAMCGPAWPWWRPRLRFPRSPNGAARGAERRRCYVRYCLTNVRL